MNKKLETIVSAIEDKKGEEILVLDFEGKNSICDSAVIATAKSDKNAQAIVDCIKEKLLEINEERIGLEGYDEGEWILVDYADVLVHIFQKEIRSYYSLEELWNEAKELVRR